MSVFIGGHVQHGRGIESVFSGVCHVVLPWLKAGGKTSLGEGVGTNLQVAQVVGISVNL